MMSLSGDSLAIGLGIGAIALAFILMWASGLKGETENMQKKLHQDNQIWKVAEQKRLREESDRELKTARRNLEEEKEKIGEFYKRFTDIRFRRDFTGRPQYLIQIYLDPDAVESLCRAEFIEGTLPYFGRWVAHAVEAKIMTNGFANLIRMQEKQDLPQRFIPLDQRYHRGSDGKLVPHDG